MTKEGSTESALKTPQIGEKKSNTNTGKLISNLIIVTILLTVIGAALITINLSFVFVLFITGMLPAITATIVDRRPGRFASKAVTAFNFAGLFPQLVAALNSGSPDTVAEDLLKNPNMWLIVYGLAGFGWAVVHIIPQISLLYFSIKADFTIKKLLRFQQTLVSEWSDKITK